MPAHPPIDYGRHASAGGSASSLLGVAFIVLKLCNVIGWSWWWVTCPFWAVPAVIIAVLLIALVLVRIAKLCMS